MSNKRLMKGARAAVKFANILAKFNMRDDPNATTVFVTKKGRVLGTVRGQKFIGGLEVK